MNAMSGVVARIRSLSSSHWHRWLPPLAAVLLAMPFSMVNTAQATEGAARGPHKIGIVGAGKMGGTLAELWSKAGYKVMISSRHPEELQSLATSLGPNVTVGKPEDAATYGDVVVISVPYGAEPQLGKDLAAELNHKVVIDLGNPYPARDGAMAEEARRLGTGVTSARFFPNVRLVRAFNAITYKDLHDDAHRVGNLVAIPIASDDAQATRVVARLVRAAGFAPVVVGGLATAKQFDVDTAVYVKPMSAADLRDKLGLPPEHHN